MNHLERTGKKGARRKSRLGGGSLIYRGMMGSPSQQKRELKKGKTLKGKLPSNENQSEKGGCERCREGTGLENAKGNQPNQEPYHKMDQKRLQRGGGPKKLGNSEHCGKH